MKKIMFLAAAVAAVFGVSKLRGKKQEDTYGEDAATQGPTNGYTPQPQQ